MRNLRQSADEDDVIGRQYDSEAKRLAVLLRPDTRKPWLHACATDFVIKCDPSGHGRRPRKPTGLLSSGTKCMIVSSTLRAFAMNFALTSPVTTFIGLISEENIIRLLDGPLGEMGDLTQIIILRGVADMADRAFGIEVPHIWHAIKRLQYRARREVTPDRQQPFEDYWDLAHELAPLMEPGDQHVPETALQSRHAATLGIALEMASRRSELAGLSTSDIIIDAHYGIVDIVVPALLRKAGITFTRRLSPSVSGLVIDYVHRARPCLLNRGGDGKTDQLWITSAGGPLRPEGVVAALQRQVEWALGNTASCNIFRRANASRSDILETETYLALQHAPGSSLGQELYAQRDLAEAQRDLLNTWDNVSYTRRSRLSS